MTSLPLKGERHSETFAICQARHARSRTVVQVETTGSLAGFKGNGARLAEALGGRYVHRYHGYLLTPRRAELWNRLHAAGFDATWKFFRRDRAPYQFTPPGSAEKLTLQQATQRVVSKSIMKTSYYQNKKLDPKQHLVVQTSIGSPRFGAQPEWETEHITPPAEIMELPEAKYRPAYRAHLEARGVDAIRAELLELIQDAQATGREVVLCCFESLKKPGQFCHRRIFAEWWLERAGEKIEEL